MPAIAIEAKNINLARARGGRPELLNVSLSVKRGEIVGVAGIEGNGQTALLEALLHPRDSNCRTSGSVNFLGHDVTHWPARKIRELGVALIPQDRHNEGLLLERPLNENFLLGWQRHAEVSRHGVLNSRMVTAAATDAIQEFDIRPGGLDLPARKLSGGNQQKLILAREFHRRPLVLIAAQPTRGVDIGAIEFIHKRIVRARDEGAGVLLVSADLDEILSLSDRILVMFEGKIVAEFLRGNADETTLGLKMSGS